MNCPECDGVVVEIPSTFDGHLYACATHGQFGVSATALPQFEQLDRDARLIALKRATLRVLPGRTPKITTYDF